MEIYVNGTKMDFEISSLTVEELIEVKFSELDKLAVAVNSIHVPKAKFETTEIKNGDSVEILSPIYGG